MAAILQNGGHFTKWQIFLLYTSADTCKYTYIYLFKKHAGGYIQLNIDSSKKTWQNKCHKAQISHLFGNLLVYFPTFGWFIRQTFK